MTFQNFLDMYDVLSEMVIPDWLENGVSDRNVKFYKEREKHHNVSQFMKAVYRPRSNSITLYFKITPTYAGGSETVDVVSLQGGKYRSKYYTLQVQFINVNDYIHTPDDWFSLTPKEQIEIVHAIIDGVDVRFHSNDMSFLYQGAWKRLDDLDSSIYPFPNKPDKNIWGQRHDNQGIYLTKHFLNTLPTLKFNADMISRSISRELESKKFKKK